MPYDVNDILSGAQDRLSLDSSDLESVTSTPSEQDMFLEEIDEWFTNIGQQLKDLEERHNRWSNQTVTMNN
ncbi:hypothetical protein V5O48_008015 [Marasmius crinis-equi]|uniref:Uncharacterized protein n=1 Tax=Marasmius crinis-equi TaxID=585013 RepID=A0ABR3FFA1_9AGAR